MASKPKECIGCKSYKTSCLLYLGFRFKEQWYIFKDRFCPCKKCIVKVSCNDKSMKHLKYKSGCREFKLAKEDFIEYCVNNKFRTTRMKIKK